MEMILVKIESDICTLTINRPDKYNALNIDVLKELELKLDWILDETSARIVIITHKTPEINAKNCLSKFKKNKNILKSPTLIRLYN